MPTTSKPSFDDRALPCVAHPLDAAPPGAERVLHLGVLTREPLVWVPAHGRWRPGRVLRVLPTYDRAEVRYRRTNAACVTSPRVETRQFARADLYHREES